MGRVNLKPFDLENALFETSRLLWISLHDQAGREVSPAGYKRQLVGATYKTEDALCCDEPATFYGCTFQARVTVARFGLSFYRDPGNSIFIQGSLTPEIVCQSDLVIPRVGSWTVDLDLLKGMDI